ncbi:MAG: hypothetical protein GY714_16410 [Desulfobacterales bacterium]|nr:hypothetical protein [Desulfobacterales bacterium]MCP4161977.1 hypothetical protein [Deltaproteobacteria bacterium]
MDDFLDTAWELSYQFLTCSVNFMDRIFSHLEFLGPVFVIFILAFLVVCLSKILKRIYVTKRLVTLKEDFEHWKSLRMEALKHPDEDKGKALAKNVDQAKLNKAYYDYFFEGMLKHFATNLIPILLMVSYVTTIYTPETLTERFNEKWVFSFSLGSAFQINVSSLLWFIISIILSYTIFIVYKMVFKMKYADI